MKKRKLLAIFAAFAVAATMAFGLSACDEGDTDNTNDNDQSQDGGDGGNTNETTDSAYTEEQWVKAWEDTIAQKSYSMIQTTAQSMPQTSEMPASSTTMNMEMTIDAVGLKGLSKMEMYTQLGDADPVRTGYTESYAEVSGVTFINYIAQFDNEDNLIWNARSNDCDTEEEAKEQLFDSNSLENMILRSEYSGTGENAEVSGTLDKLYSLFTYDSENKTYTATLSLAGMGQGAPDAVNIEISFKDGKLYELISEYTIVESGIPITVSSETTITYEVSLTIPQAAKDALAAQEQ